MAAHRVEFRVRHFGGVFVFRENSGLDMGQVKKSGASLARTQFSRKNGLSECKKALP